MSRLKGIMYRSWGFPVREGRSMRRAYRAEWLAKISEAGVRRRAEALLPTTRRPAGLCANRCGKSCWRGKKHGRVEIVTRDSVIGPIRAALLIALIQTPHRFRTQATALDLQVGLESRPTAVAEHRCVQGELATLEEAGPPFVV